MKILIADDDSVSRYATQKILERSGYEILVTGNGREAAEILLSMDGPRMALLDWMMPDSEGPNVCREVRSQAQHPYVYMVLLTSKESTQDIIAGLEAGADDFLIKPCDPEELKARLRAGQRILQLEDRLLHEARHDPLTGVANRALLLERLERAVRRASRRHDSKFAVLYFDIDRFKIINDTMGHLAGDQLIRETAERLVQCVRKDGPFASGELDSPVRPMGDDTVGRLGGDEFAILLEDIGDSSDAIRVAERIQERIAQPFIIGGRPVSVSASLGIALSAGEYIAAKDMLSDADAAMYRAKSMGRSRYVVSDPAMQASAVNRLRLETDLRRAVERDEFRVHYQPLVSLRDFRILGFEALVRWQRPDFGLVLPLGFLSAAEETGLILPIGAWVLREACRQGVAWNRHLPEGRSFRISVNISEKQFSQLTLVSEVERALAESALEPSTLSLEISEEVVMLDPAGTTRSLNCLKALGVRFSLDNFGTGFSSMPYLRRFSLDTLKLDRSFVAEIINRGEDREIVRTMIALGRNLGMELIAEGVETGDELKILESLGCECAQGNLFLKPSEPVHIGRLLAKAEELESWPSLVPESRQQGASASTA